MTKSLFLNCIFIESHNWRKRDIKKEQSITLYNNQNTLWKVYLQDFSVTFENIQSYTRESAVIKWITTNLNAFLVFDYFNLKTQTTIHSNVHYLLQNPPNYAAQICVIRRLADCVTTVAAKRLITAILSNFNQKRK